jgi:hypothetical protein
MRRTEKYVAMTRNEGNAIDGPFSATCQIIVRKPESIKGKESHPEA